MTTIVIKDLTKRYNAKGPPPVDRLTLTVPAGSLTTLLGPSGCGKTSVLKMLSGIIAPTAGDIRFGDRSVLGIRPERRNASMMFQGGLLFPHMDVAANVGFGLRMQHLPVAERTARVGAMLERIRLPHLADRRVAELSGGQQSRVALARALIIDPDILLLDEPLAALDAHLRVEMRDLIRAMQQETGITTLLVTHDQEEAVALSDHVALMLGGRIRQFGVPEDFFRRPVDEETARFFGGCNFIRGRARAGIFEGALGTLRLARGAPDGAGLLTFRPESLRVGMAGQDRRTVNGQGANILTGQLVSRSFLGARSRLLIRVGEVELIAERDPASADMLTIGDHLTMTIPPDATWMIRDPS